MSKIVLFQTIQFIISPQFSSIRLIVKTLSGATTSSHSGPENDGNERLLCIPQSSSVTGASPPESLMSYTGYSLVESYPSVEKQSVYSTAPASWAN